MLLVGCKNLIEYSNNLRVAINISSNKSSKNSNRFLYTKSNTNNLSILLPMCILLSKLVLYLLLILEGEIRRREES